MKTSQLFLGKMAVILSVLAFSLVSQADEQRERVYVTKREALARECKLGFKDATIGSTCITTQVPSWFAKEDELVRLYGEFKKVEITLANGDVVRATEMVGTGVIFEDAILVGAISTIEAIKHCEDKGLKLPTGYPEYLNGQRGFPNKDSDLMSALKRHFGDAFLVNEIKSDMEKYNYSTERYVLSSSVGENPHDLRAFQLYLHSGWELPNQLSRYMDYDVAYPDSAVRCVKYQ